MLDRKGGAPLGPTMWQVLLHTTFQTPEAKFKGWPQLWDKIGGATVSDRASERVCRTS